VAAPSKDTIQPSREQARTFDFRAGEVGYVPSTMGHYAENTGTTTLRFLEVFKSSYYTDLPASRKQKSPIVSANGRCSPDTANRRRAAYIGTRIGGLAL